MSKWTQEADKTLESLGGGCPFRIIRYVEEDGKETFLGDAVIGRWGFPDVDDLVERARVKEENERKEVGDSSIVWTFGGKLRAVMMHVDDEMWYRFFGTKSSWKRCHDGSYQDAY